VDLDLLRADHGWRRQFGRKRHRQLRRASVWGRHRAHMSSFVRDGKRGGCAVGTPPENLGFRLVRDQDPIIAKAGKWLRGAFRSAMPDAV